MRMLHMEAIEHLELMQTTLKAAEQGTDSMADTLDAISMNHWNSYLDVLHMITMHDAGMNQSIKRFGAVGDRVVDSPGEDQLSIRRVNVIFLTDALLRRHRRMEHVFSMRNDPMAEYRQSSLSIERDHIAHLIAMTQSIL